MIRIKICGLRRLEDALVAADEGADAVGFNFWKGSKRYIEPKEAGDIVRELPPFVTAVGVFVNASEEDILAAMRDSLCSTIQLHGDESPGFAKVFSRKVIKAFRLEPDLDVERIEAYQPFSAILLDTMSRGYGGSGQVGDWDLAAKVARHYRVILAGGLTPDNVGDAVAKVKPFAVDVAGGVEKSPGVKDHKKIRDFIKNARRTRATRKTK